MQQHSKQRPVLLIILFVILGFIAFMVIGALLIAAFFIPVRTETSADVSGPTPIPSSGVVNGLQGILATTDLAVGENRISFLLLTPDALVTAPEAVVSVRPAGTFMPAVPQMASAGFHLWPFGTRGSYVTALEFDTPGEWELAVEVVDEGEVKSTRLPLHVRPAAATPPVGALPPLSVNKTLRDVQSFNELTTWARPDPDLYQTTIAEAAASGMPSLIVFSTPALCTSPTCGPQVDTAQELKEKYKGQAHFIHVEVYENPQEIQGDLRNARYAPAVEEWGLTEIEDYLNESWVFILDKQGRVAAKYEGYASFAELEEGLRKVLA